MPYCSPDRTREWLLVLDSLTRANGVYRVYVRGFPFLAGVVGSVQENIFLNGHFFSSAGISKQSMGARNQEGIGLSYWPARLHSLAELVLKKPDGSRRPCDDFHCLNNLTVPDTYPLPSKMDFSARVTGCKFFLKINFKIFMHPDDIPKTAIITPFGLFEFLRLPFGLRNARSTFQGMMDWVLAEFPIVFAYLDDIVVASKSLEQHEKDVEEVFPPASGLLAWPTDGEKCEFAVQEVQFIGHHVTAEGIRHFRKGWP